MDPDTLIYLYGIVPEDAPEPPAALLGLEDGSVWLLRAAGLAAVIGGVPEAVYGEEALNPRLQDLAWVGERGLAHERVLTWFADRVPVVPLSPFSLHEDEERVRARLEEESLLLQDTLARLKGRQEWGVKLWRQDGKLAAHLEELSPRLRALAAELESAAPGRRFLLAKKRDSLRGEELRSVGKEAAHEVYGILEECAERSALLPVAGGAGGAGERALVLHAAFLVREEEFPAFQRRLSEAALRYTALGFEIEFTGPWPPYHFVSADAA